MKAVIQSCHKAVRRGVRNVFDYRIDNDQKVDMTDSDVKKHVAK